MESLKLNFKFWLIGVIAGVVLVERWRRYGKRNAVVVVGVPGDEVLSTTTAPVSADKPKVSASIATGAKADAERVKRLLGRSTPETATSSST